MVLQKMTRSYKTDNNLLIIITIMTNTAHLHIKNKTLRHHSSNTLYNETFSKDYYFDS